MGVPVEIPPQPVLDKFEQLFCTQLADGWMPLSTANTVTQPLITRDAAIGRSLMPWFDSAKGCVDVETRGTNSRPPKYVRLTTKGVEALLHGRGIKHLKKLLSQAASIYQSDAYKIALQILVQNQRQSNEKEKEIQHQQATIAQAVNEIAFAYSEQLAREKASWEDRRRILSDLEQILRSDERNEAPPVDREVNEGPKKESDFDFQIATAQELVFAWKDAANEEAALQLERVLDNVPGVERIGEPGEVSTFNGQYHETTDPIRAGESAIVTRSGWLLKNERGTTLLARARVKQP